MKAAWLLVFLLSLLGGGFRTISSINKYTSEAAQAYKSQEYVEAIAAYEYLLNQLEVEDDQLRLNLAHSYYNAGQFSKALQEYRLLADNASHQLRSVAHLQLGNIATKQKKYKQALSLYKQALVASPGNEAARYNYELLKKYLDLHPETAEQPEQPLTPPEQAPEDSVSTPPSAEEEPQAKNKPDSEGDKEEETEQPQPDKEGETGTGGTSNKKNEKPPQQQEKEQASGSEKGDTEGMNRESQFDPRQQERSGGYENASDNDARAQTRRTRLQQANISPDKAKLLLDAMRNAELQYIQQLPKKAGKKPDRSIPDW
ncbi:aerotolerance protein [Pontibacter sp. MBLB2868]|uniref:aerotolerance protein n=1 Tax=Pontibacter sp. MBLB2868 TaxID=3451555 RepID=UPI003F754422